MSIFLARRDEMQQGAKTAPSYRSVAVSTVGFQTAITIGKPTGAIQGDRVVIGVQQNASGTAAIANSGTPSTAWTNHGTFVHANGIGRVTVLSKILSGSEPSTWSVTGISNVHASCAISIAVQDGDQTIGTLVTNGNASGGGSPLATAAVPTTDDNAIIVKFVVMEEESTGTSTTATWTTITERADIQSSGSGAGMTAATELQATAGAGNARNCAVTGTTPQLSHAGIAVY